jgi:hypothetical protein
MVVGENKSAAKKKSRQIEGNFDCHGNAVVRRGAHRPMEHILKATGCRDRASASAVSSRHLPWSTNMLKQHKTLTNHNF